MVSLSFLFPDRAYAAMVHDTHDTIVLSKMFPMSQNNAHANISIDLPKTCELFAFLSFVIFCHGCLFAALGSLLLALLDVLSTSVC